nr:MAG TPA: hypothetical protein [Caudoviricetes sp.]
MSNSQKYTYFFVIHLFPNNTNYSRPRRLHKKYHLHLQLYE